MIWLKKQKENEARIRNNMGCNVEDFTYLIQSNYVQTWVADSEIHPAPLLPYLSQESSEPLSHTS